MGKSALLEYVAQQASGYRVVSTVGVESEMELTFAALHQLCATLLDHLEAIPEPQRDALLTIFGISPGPVPDRFLVGLGVLSLLAEAATECPMLCLVDDEQWIDRASAQVLAFVGRRVGIESVGLLFGARMVSGELSQFPQLIVEGLRGVDARALLDSVLTAPVDPRVRDQIVAETRGNPLALLELPRDLKASELAGGFGLASAVALSGPVEETFSRRTDALPRDTRRLLLLAAADPLGDPVLLWRAVARLGISATAARMAEDAGLIELGAHVRFRHPLARSAAYHSLSAAERREAHAVLAEVTDSTADPERRAWHRAQAAARPDDDVAAELELCAGRAQARAGLAGAAAFLERATLLTSDPALRARRALAAAAARIEAGALGAARELLAIAEAGPLGDLERAHLDLVRTQMGFETLSIGESGAGMLQAAKRLAPVDTALARRTFLHAIGQTITAERFATPGADVIAVAGAVAALPPRDPSSPADLLLDGWVAVFHRGYPAGVPILREAVRADAADVPPEDRLSWLGLGRLAACHIWDDHLSIALTDQYVSICRGLGAASRLPNALSLSAVLLVLAGDLAGAGSLVEEAEVAKEAAWNATALAPYGALAAVAARGNDSEAAALISSTLLDASRRGEGIAVSAAEWANAVLNNGLGHYDEALSAAERASENHSSVGFSNWAVPELIEAAARTRMWDTATDAHRRLAEMTAASGTDWALGLEARSRALLRNGDEAENLYRLAIVRLERTRLRIELARAHLVYGEWLRRERRRIDARDQLRIAHKMFDTMGMEAFAERARRELRATGETAHKRGVKTRSDLTPQEAQVAKLAHDGLSNPEIGARLFISARTAQYHLSKVFTKLGITSRAQLHRALP